MKAALILLLCVVAMASAQGYVSPVMIAGQRPGGGIVRPSINPAFAPRPSGNPAYRPGYRHPNPEARGK